MGPKEITYTTAQVKEMIAKNEETIMKFFKMTVERLETKIEKLQTENISMKHDIADLNKAMAFQNESFEEKTKKVDELLQDVKKNSNNNTFLKTRNEELEDKVSDLEDRSRRNNLRFDGIIEEEGESWEITESKVMNVIKQDLNIEENIKIERAHRSGRIYRQDNSKNDKRTIVIKFLNYKDKERVLHTYRKVKLWESKIFVNEDFSRKTMLKRKELFQQAKELKASGVKVKVVYNRLVYETPISVVNSQNLHV